MTKFTSIIGVIFAFGSIAALIAYEANSTPPNGNIPQETKPVQTDVLEVADIDVMSMYELVNKQRADAGQQPLRLDPALNASALEKCNDMVTRNYWSHNAPDGVEPWRIVEKYYDYRVVGENLAYGYDSSGEVLEGWIASSGHKKNILDPQFKDVGYSVCYSPYFNNDKESLVIVQHFGDPR